MASSVSSLNNYSGAKLFNFGDMNLLVSGMAAMQGRVDQNKSNLENIKNQLSLQFSDSIARPEDREYFNERLEKAMSIVNEYSATADLSDTNIANQLAGKLYSIVDDRVIDSISSTKTRQLQEARLRDIQQNDPSKYDPANKHVFDQAWNEYMNSKDPYAVYKGGDYEEYVDIFGELTGKEGTEVLKNLGINGQWVQRADGGLYFDFKNKYEGTKDLPKLKQAVQQIIGNRGLRQMQINAEYKYGDYNNPNVLQSFRQEYNNYYTSLNSELVQSKEALEKLISSATSNEKKEQYQSELDLINNQISQVSDRNFDSDVGDNGVLNPSKYKSMYTTYNTNKEMEYYTNLMYQKPTLIDYDIEDTKLDILKFNQNVKQFDLNYRLNLAKFEFEKEKFEVQQATKGLKPNGSPLSGGKIGINPNEVGKGASTPLDTESQLGSNNTYTLIREEQNNAIKKVNDLVGGAMSRGSTMELMEELTGKDIATLKEVKIAGRVIRIDDSNRGDVLLALNNFKNVFLDGTSTVRDTRNRMSTALSSAVNLAISHFNDSPSDQENLNLNRANFYFEKTANGQYEYKEGNLKAGVPNYKLLAQKASKPGGMSNLTEAEKITLKAYVAKGVIETNNLGLNDWHKQQLFGALQEDIYSTTKSSKAVSSMPTYQDFSKAITGSSIARLDQQSKILLPTQLYLPSGGTTTNTTSFQDVTYGGIGFTDGWNLKAELDKVFNPVVINSNDMAFDKIRTTNIGSLNIDAKTISGKNIANFAGVPIPDKAIINIKPQISNNVETGKYIANYTVTTKNKSGEYETKLYPIQTPEGTDIVFTQEDIGVIAPSKNSIYNSTYGTRAATLSLGSSAVIKNSSVLGSTDNELPSQNFFDKMSYVKETYKNSREVSAWLQQEENNFKSGKYSFELSTAGVEGGTYKLYMKNSEGNSAPIYDTGLKSLDENSYLRQVLQNRKQVIEDNFINEYILKQLK